MVQHTCTNHRPISTFHYPMLHAKQWATRLTVLSFAMLHKVDDDGLEVMESNAPAQYDYWSEIIQAVNDQQLSVH